jgi:hypothetical protein
MDKDTGLHIRHLICTRTHQYPYHPDGYGLEMTAPKTVITKTNMGATTAPPKKKKTIATKENNYIHCSP